MKVIKDTESMDELNVRMVQTIDPCMPDCVEDDIRELSRGKCITFDPGSWISPGFVGAMLEQKGFTKFETTRSSAWLAISRPFPLNHMVVFLSHVDGTSEMFVGDAEKITTAILGLMRVAFQKRLVCRSVLDMPAGVAMFWYRNIDVIMASEKTSRTVLPKFDWRAAEIFAQMCTRITRAESLVVKAKAVENAGMFNLGEYCRGNWTEEFNVAMMILFAIYTEEGQTPLTWTQVEEQVWAAALADCKKESHPLLEKRGRCLKKMVNGDDDEANVLKVQVQMLALLVELENENGAPSKNNPMFCALSELDFDQLFQKANPTQRIYFEAVRDDALASSSVMGTPAFPMKGMGQLIDLVNEDFPYLFDALPRTGRRIFWGTEGVLENETWIVPLFSGNTVAFVTHEKTVPLLRLLSFTIGRGAFNYPVRAYNMLSPLLARMFIDAEQPIPEDVLNADAAEGLRAGYHLIILRLMLRLCSATEAGGTCIRKALVDKERGAMLSKMMRLLPRYVLFEMNKPFQNIPDDQTYQKSLELLAADVLQNGALRFYGCISPLIAFARSCSRENPIKMLRMNVEMILKTFVDEEDADSDTRDMLNDILNDQERRQRVAPKPSEMHSNEGFFFLFATDEIVAVLEVVFYFAETNRHNLAFEILQALPRADRLRPAKRSHMPFIHLEQTIGLYSDQVFSAEANPMPVERRYEHVNTFECWLANFLFLTERVGDAAQTSGILNMIKVNGLIPSAEEYPLFFQSGVLTPFKDVFRFPSGSFNGPSSLVSQIVYSFAGVLGPTEIK